VTVVIGFEKNYVQNETVRQRKSSIFFVPHAFDAKSVIKPYKVLQKQDGVRCRKVCSWVRVFDFCTALLGGATTKCWIWKYGRTCTDQCEIWQWRADHMGSLLHVKFPMIDSGVWVWVPGWNSILEYIDPYGQLLDRVLGIFQNLFAVLSYLRKLRLYVICCLLKGRHPDRNYFHWSSVSSATFVILKYNAAVLNWMYSLNGDAV